MNESLPSLVEGDGSRPAAEPFRLILEMEPPRIADLGKVRRQIAVAQTVADAVLVPDNHLGLPAMSSVAVACEIKAAGLTPIVALNARDRNHLRLASDLMTLEAYGIDEVLFLYGDEITEGRSTLTVRKMLSLVEGRGFRVGVVSTQGRPLGWRAKADFLMTKLDFEPLDADRWRRTCGFQHRVYCGVLALPDAVMARKIAGNIPGLNLPEGYLESLERDDEHGFKVALDMLSRLRQCGGDGAQIVIPARRKRFAEMLSKWKAGEGLAP
jgi:methylenetetrahydrofolate reductase (NADPH)